MFHMCERKSEREQMLCLDEDTFLHKVFRFLQIIYLITESGHCGKKHHSWHRKENVSLFQTVDIFPVSSALNPGGPTIMEDKIL